jgi:hypothetical protein
VLPAGACCNQSQAQERAGEGAAPGVEALAPHLCGQLHTYISSCAYQKMLQLYSPSNDAVGVGGVHKLLDTHGLDQTMQTEAHQAVRHTSPYGQQVPHFKYALIVLQAHRTSARESRVYTRIVSSLKALSNSLRHHAIALNIHIQAEM